MSLSVEKTLPPAVELDLANCLLDGRNLIEAAAGTGKTFAITRLYLRLLLERKLVPREILVVTFTEAATRELRERIRATLSEALRMVGGGVIDADEVFFRTIFSRIDRGRARAQLTEALRSFDSAAIYTIHGFCRQVLFEHAFESGTLFAAEIIADERELRELVAADFWRRHFYHASPLFLAYVAAEKCSGPDWFCDLYNVRKGVEPYRLLPQAPEDPDTTDEEARLAETIAQAAAARLWNSDRTAIIALLASPSLKQTSYSPKIIDRVCGRVDELLEQGFLDQEGMADLEKITASGLASGTRKGESSPAHPFFEACEETRSHLVALHDVFGRKFLNLKIKFLSTIDGYLAKVKERRSLLGFDDLLRRVSAALLDKKTGDRLCSALRAAYKAALIDEFQDTDPVQYAIFNAIFKRDLPLFFIGDPKQAIYRFRGADIYAYFEASRNASMRYTLATNYRSDPLLLDAINRLFIGHCNPFVFKPVEYRPVKAGLGGTANVLTIDGERQKPFVLWLFQRDAVDSVEPLAKSPSSNLVTEAVTAEIGHLLSAAARGGACLGDRDVKPSDIAVLVRTNREAALVREVLGRANIPAILYMSGSVFGSFEAVEYEILLAALSEPQRNEYVRAALATSFFGLTADKIDGLESDDRKWSARRAQFIAYHEEWRKNGILPVLRRLMNDERVRERLLPCADGERRLTNILHLAELLHTEGLRSRAPMSTMVKWLSEKLRNCADGVPPDEEMMRLESDEEAIRIVTIHKSKGLEYPVVFCPFTWNATQLPIDKSHKKPFIFHDPDHDFAASMALDAESIRQYRPIAEEELLAENVRLLYVAMTRAKARCYCAWGPVKGAESSALGWVLFGRNIESDPVAGLRATIAGLSDRSINGDLAHLQGDGAGGIEITPVPESSPRVIPRIAHAGQPLRARPFHETIQAPRRILSYSVLAHSLPLSDREYADDIYFPRVMPAEKAGPTSFSADFPRGAEAGTFLHSVLETIDFGRPISQETTGAIAAGLARFGFSSVHQKNVERMIGTVAETVLDQQSGLRLDRVPRRQYVREMEFYFPVEPFMQSDVFEAAGEAKSPLSLPELKCSGGHLKGYIDMVFEWQDRFYIIDWKSNHLGNDEGAYSPAVLADVMAREHYLLQYHLYAVALHRYLRLRKPGYSYGKNFGGVYYLFLRGLENPVKRDGIFFACPDEERIRHLCNLLSDGKS